MYRHSDRIGEEKTIKGERGGEVNVYWLIYEGNMMVR